jgi:regulator of RNase E activity RraB
MVPFPEYEFEVGSRADQQWSTYREFLFPSNREYQTIMNSRVLSELEKSGDNHDIERSVCHWVHFATAEDRRRFVEIARSKGFSEASSNDDGQGERPFGLSIARVHAVDYLTINHVVLELFDLAEEHQGEYSGWETSVEDGSESEEA